MGGVRRLAVAVLVAVLIVVGTGAPAWAHNAFAGSTPKDGAVLDLVPATVNLKFLEKLVPANITVTLVDPAGAPAMSGAPAFDGPTVLIPLRATVAGVYTATYAVKSTDGHPVTGKITFTLTPVAVPPPPSPTAAPPPPPPTSAPAAEPTPVLAGDESDGGTPWWPWAVGAALVVAGLVMIIARRRRASAT